MAKIRNTFSGLRNGRIGGITYYSQRGVEIARVAQNSSNYGETASRTAAQQTRRVMWANLVNYYKYSRRWLQKAFQSKGDRQTDYNAFMAANLGLASVPLTRSQALSGMCVLQEFVVSRGTLNTATDSVTAAGLLMSRLACTLTLGESTTVGDFSANLIANNDDITENMQISLIVLRQSLDTDDPAYAYISGNGYEVTLSSSSTELLSAYMPLSTLQVSGGYLAASIGLVGAGYWIISITSGNTTFVSSEVLQITTPRGDEWATDAQLAAAIESYGLTEDVFLTSGSSQIGTTGGSGGSGGSSGGGSVEE